MSASDHNDAALADILATVQRSIAAEERGWRRVWSWPTARRRLVAVAVVAICVSLVAVLTPRPDLAAYPVARMVASVGLLAAATVIGARSALRPPHVASQRPTMQLALATVLLLIPVLAAFVPAPHADIAAYPESFAGCGDDFVPRAVACLVFGLVLSAPAIAALVVLDRRGAPAGVRVVLLAAVGALAGLAGLLVHCPVVATEHQLLGHASVGPVAVALLAAVALVVRRARTPAARS